MMEEPFLVDINHQCFFRKCSPKFTAGFADGHDIALVRLDANTTVTAALRYSGDAEQGVVGTIVGYGLPGIGSHGQSDGASTGIKRAGPNVIDVTGATAGPLPTLGQISDRIILSDFDNPGDPLDSSWGSSTPLDLEFFAAQGDSGGAVFLDVNGTHQLAGVISFREKGPISNPGGDLNSSYGEVMGSTRISSFNEWIDTYVNSRYWDHNGSGNFATGGHWDEGVVPGPGEIAVFNVDGNYTVSLTGNATNERFLMRSGDVTLDLGGATYTLTGSPARPSVVVAPLEDDTASLTITNGVLSSVDGVIAEKKRGSLAIGDVTVTGLGTRWDLSGSLFVGGNPNSENIGGSATLTIDNGAEVNVGGTLVVFSGDTVSVLDGNLTANAIDLRNGNLSNGGDLMLNGPSRWESGTISGPGTITVAVGNTLTFSDAFNSMSERAIHVAGTL